MEIAVATPSAVRPVKSGDANTARVRPKAITAPAKAVHRMECERPSPSKEKSFARAEMLLIIVLHSLAPLSGAKRLEQRLSRANRTKAEDPL